MRKVEGVNILCVMVNVNMMVNLEMINHMVKVKHNMRTEIFIMVNSKRVRRMVKENLFIIKQRTCMKESLEETNEQDSEP